MAGQFRGRDAGFREAYGQLLLELIANRTIQTFPLAQRIFEKLELKALQA
jgi:hypothetical protein